MGIQHQIGADIIFAFDELTTLVNTRLPGTVGSAPTPGRSAAWTSTAG
jgi:hypothetical protein